MMDMDDTINRKKLVDKYLKAETTIEEEHMLRTYYGQVNDPVLPEDADMCLLMEATDRLKDDFMLSDEKAAEFDRLMEVRPAKRRKVVYGLIPAAAAAVFFLFLMIKGYVHKGDADFAIAEVLPETDAYYTGPENLSQYIADMTAAVNFQKNGQVEEYRIQPVGDVTIVTKTLTDGSSSSFIVHVNDNNVRVVPMNKE